MFIFSPFLFLSLFHFSFSVNYLPYFFILIHSVYCIFFFLTFFLWEKNWSSFNKKNNNFSSFWCQDVHIFSNKNNNTNNINMYIPKKKSVERIKKTIYLSHCAKVFKLLLYSMRIWVCKLKKKFQVYLVLIYVHRPRSKVLMSQKYFMWLTLYQFTLCHWNVPLLAKWTLPTAKKKSFVDI